MAHEIPTVRFHSCLLHPGKKHISILVSTDDRRHAYNALETYIRHRANLDDDGLWVAIRSIGLLSRIVIRDEELCMLDSAQIRHLVEQAGWTLDYYRTEIF